MKLRRRWLALWLLAAALLGCAGVPPRGPAPPPPIVFVHGNGDSAALWLTTMWRFESNGWPREHLYAVEFPYPNARDDDALPQTGRSSTDDQRRQLGEAIDRVLAATGAAKVVLMGNSRGGYAIRNYIEGGGAGKVSHAILGGTPNHGVWAIPDFQPGSEFNGSGPFLSRLNAPRGIDGAEVTPGVAWLTIRSDHNDKFSQPMTQTVPPRATGVGYDSPALKGAKNVVLPQRDHRETAYHPEAFAAAYEFITGHAPATTAALAQPQVTLDGTVTGYIGDVPDNLPLAGARVAVYAVDAASGLRIGQPLVDRVVGADGRWGPVQTDSRTPLEFAIREADGATTHIYRSPFARSSAIVNLRPEHDVRADRTAAAVVVFKRPRGYFALPRDTVVLDGQPSPRGITPGLAVDARVELVLADSARAVAASFRSGPLDERIVGRTWPYADRHVTVLELHY